MVRTQLSRSPRHQCSGLEDVGAPPRPPWEAGCSRVLGFPVAGPHADADSLSPPLTDGGPVAGAGPPPAFREQIPVTSPRRRAASRITSPNGRTILDRVERLTRYLSSPRFPLLGIPDTAGVFVLGRETLHSRATVSSGRLQDGGLPASQRHRAGSSPRKLPAVSSWQCKRLLPPAPPRDTMLAAGGFGVVRAAILGLPVRASTFFGLRTVCVSALKFLFAFIRRSAAWLISPICKMYIHVAVPW